MSEMLPDDLAAFDQLIGFEPETAAPDEGTPAPEATPDPVETPAVEEPTVEPEATPEERTRDEQGRFTKQETVEEQAETLLAGKYKTAEELEEAYENLQSRLGEQGSELGSLRQTLERLNENLERPAPEPPQATQQISQAQMDWFEDQLDENPQGAAYWAAQNDPSGALVEKALDAWYDVAPRQASQFEMTARLHDQEEMFRQQLEERTLPLQETAKRSAIGDAWASARAELPDLDAKVPQIIEAAKFAPEVAKGLGSDDAQERVSAVKKLYFLAGGMSGLPTQTPAAPAVGVPAAPAPTGPSAEDVKLSGSVATQTQTQDPEQVDPGAQWLKDIGFDAVLDRYSPVDD